MSLRPEIVFVKGLMPHRSINFTSTTKGETTMTNDNKSRVLRLAEWREERIATHGPWPKRAAAMGAVGIAVLGSGVAFAAWTANGSGTASAQAASINFQVTAVGTTASSNPLHPGSAAGTASGDTTGGDLTVHIKNDSGFPIKITAIQQYGLVGTSNTGTCANDTGTAGSAGTSSTAATAPTGVSSASGVSVGSPTGLTPYLYTLATPQTVATGADADVTVANALSMSTSSATGCQGLTFTIPVQVQTSS